MECLVTKLKGIVDDNSLAKLGVITLELIEGEYYNSLSSNGNSELSVVSGSVAMKNYNTSAPIYLPAKLSNSGEFVRITVTGGAVVEISNKYDVTSLNALSRIMKPIDIGELAYMYSLTSLNEGVRSRELAGVVGDLVGIIPFKNLERVKWNNESCVGNISNLGYLPKLNYFECYGSRVSGSFEGLVNVARSQGRTSGTINLGYFENISFNGEVVRLMGNSVLSWTANTITWNGTTINA